MNESKIFNPIRPMVLPTTNNVTSTPVRKNIQVTNVGFQNVLEKEILSAEKIKFSKHAEARLSDRNINLSEAQLEQLGNAVDKAAAKGARESLVLMDNQLAFVVSVKNRTVITAMDGASIKDNIFTNIDSAIVM